MRNLIIRSVYFGLLNKGRGISNLKTNSSKFFRSCNFNKFVKLLKFIANEFKNFQTNYGSSDQNKKNTNLWQKINSGSQFYSKNYVAGNLCWLHSATNVLNYYNSN